MKSPGIIILLLFSGLLFAQSRNSEYDNNEENAYQEADLPAVSIKEVKDFKQLFAQAKRENKVILLEMSATYCGYCRTLEAEIIKPMLRSGDYEHDVLIRQLAIDGYYTIKDKNGRATTPAKIANQMNIFVTPTLLFLDSNGKEVSKRIIGVYTLEYYGGYVDAALNEGLQPLGKHLRTQ